MVTIDLIRKRLSEAIQQTKFSQCELSKNLGVNQAQISRYLHEKDLPALDTFANLCILLDVDPAYILGIKNN